LKQYLWTFDIKFIFLVVLKCKKIQKCILPCENFDFVTKMSRNFAIFRDTKFRDREISSTTLPRGDCLMKKTEGRKSRATVPLK
jgi:hypothetical protein